MLWEASVVGGYRLAGLDGEIGSVRDFYFDDRSWVIRYLIAALYPPAKPGASPAASATPSSLP